MQIRQRELALLLQQQKDLNYQPSKDLFTKLIHPIK